MEISEPLHRSESTSGSDDGAKRGADSSDTRTIAGCDVVEPVLLGSSSFQLLLFTRLRTTALDFDEGTYLLSLDALRSGQALGNDVFAAQPPASTGSCAGSRRCSASTRADQARDRDVCRRSGRWGPGCGTFLAGPVAGLLAAALLAVSPPISLFGARVLPTSRRCGCARCARARCLSPAGGSRLAAPHVASLLRSQRAPRCRGSIIVPVLLVLILLAGDGRVGCCPSPPPAPARCAVVLLTVHARALGEMWASVIHYHRQARATPAVIDRWASIGDLFNPRTPVLWIVVAGVIVFAIRVMRRSAPPAEAALWGWAAARSRSSRLCATSLQPSRRPAGGARRRGRTSLGAGCSALAGWERVGAWHSSCSSGRLRAAVAPRERCGRGPVSRGGCGRGTLRRVTHRRDFVATDLPVAGVLAHRLVPGPLVDAAYLRFETGSLTPARVLEVIDSRCVKAVVVGRSYRVSRIVAGLRERFDRSSSGLGVTVFSRRRGA